MTTFSLGTIWEETIAFLRREAALLIPVALAIFAPAQVLLSLGMAGAATLRTAAGVAASAQMLLTIPAVLLVLFGNLAISRIVLTPGGSVREGLGSAARRLPRSLGTMLLLASAFIAVGIAIVVVVVLGAMVFSVDPRSKLVSDQIAGLMVVTMFVLLIRLLLLVPVLAMENRSAAEVIRRAWALSRTNVVRFAAVWALTLFLGVFIALIEQFVVGSLIALLKLAVGDVELLSAVETLINAGIQAMLSLAMAVYIALVYRRIAIS